MSYSQYNKLPKEFGPLKVFRLRESNERMIVHTRCPKCGRFVPRQAVARTKPPTARCRRCGPVKLIWFIDQPTPEFHTPRPYN